MIENTQNNQEDPQMNHADNLMDDLNSDLADNLWDIASPSGDAAKESSTPTVESSLFWDSAEGGDIWDELEASVTDLEATLGASKIPNEEHSEDASSENASDSETPKPDGEEQKIDLANVLSSLVSGKSEEAAAEDASESEKDDESDKSSAASESSADASVDVEMTDVEEDASLSSEGDDADFDIGENAFSSMDITTEGGEKETNPLSASDRDPTPQPSELEMSQLRQQVSEIAQDEGPVVEEKASAASEELRGLLQINKKDEDAKESEDAQSEADDSSEDEETDEDDDEIRLSERARMGRVIPEGEIIVSEHELGHDVIYSEAECHAAAPRKSSNAAKFALCVAIVILAAVACVALYMKSDKPAEVPYIQKGAFQLENEQFSHIFYSSARNHIVMCSDQHGVVWSGGRMVSEFWPGMSGCTKVIMSEDGSKVWYLDNNAQLFEVNLVAGFGFNPKQIADLSGMIGDEFSVNKDSVAYFVQDEKLQQSLRRINLASGETTDVSIPEDALPCSGLKDGVYAYVSKDSIHLFNQNGETAASLEAPKYGCSRISALSCTINGTEDWAVLCNDSIRQGKGKQALEPIHYNNVALRSGAATHQLIRHDDGTELVTTDQWIRLDNRNNLNIVTLKQPLDNGFEVAYHADAKTPLIGLNHDIIKFSPDGQVKPVAPAHPRAIYEFSGAAFVGDGSHAVALSANYTEGKSMVQLWDLQEGRLVNTTPLNGIVEELNISSKGRYGFVVNELNGHISWINWLTGELMGETVPENPIESVAWSPDEKYIILYYVNQNAELFAVDEKTVSSLRSYQPNAVIAFANSELLWHIQDGEVYYERISDGARSVINNKLTDRIGSMNISHILAHPYSDEVFFWGEESGIWLYNVANGRVKLLSDKAVSWLVPDRSGNYIATSAGLFELSTDKLKPLPEDVELDRPLRWVGYNQYLQTADGHTLIDWQNQRIQNVIPDVTKLRFAGLGDGEHPSKSILLSGRHHVLTLEQIQNDAPPRTISAFGGNDTKSWCWISANGEIQASGNSCISFLKDSEGKPQIAANNPAVSNSLKSLFAAASRSFTPTPIAFVDQVKLSIKTVPEDAYLAFFPSEGDLPAALNPGEDQILSAPFETNLSLDLRGFAVMARSDGYTMRIASFRPVSESISLRIPLLPDDADSTVAVKWFTVIDTDNDAENPESAAIGEPIEVSEDLDIEMRAMAYAHASELRECLKKQPAPRHLLLSLRDNQLVAAEAALEEELRACVAPVVDALNTKHREGALPELSEMANINIDIQLLK